MPPKSLKSRAKGKAKGVTTQNEMAGAPTKTGETQGLNIFEPQQQDQRRITRSLAAAAFNIRDEVVLSTNISYHVFNDSKWFCSLIAMFKEPRTITDGCGKAIKATGTGNVMIVSGAEGELLELSEAFFAPEVPFNVVSVGKLRAAGYEIDYSENKLLFENFKMPVVYKIQLRNKVLVFADPKPFDHLWE
ncbi:hypothetical protein XA68_17875 [Ophiocordyceps unilateralis]|uniref:Retrovirus-related Pol polyprotein from transposon TNT 1-94-like beta-barrel domain-containing protein n=1 Tax=Ophiocordyceps unilateralis TaxID=268505 RepID=A0A2A9PJM7_OPHUN|nr:hypothetical protein XA68_17875 [Ophiocordyceps unilateralis]